MADSREAALARRVQSLVNETDYLRKENDRLRCMNKKEQKLTRDVGVQTESNLRQTQIHEFSGKRPSCSQDVILLEDDDPYLWTPPFSDPRAPIATWCAPESLRTPLDIKVFVMRNKLSFQSTWVPYFQQHGLCATCGLVGHRHERCMFRSVAETYVSAAIHGSAVQAENAFQRYRTAISPSSEIS